MSREVKLYSLEPGLLVEPDAAAPVRFVVVTAEGPRHVDLATLRALVDAPVPLTQAEVERIVSDNAQAIASRVKGPDVVPVEVEPLDVNTLPVHFDVHPAHLGAFLTENPITTVSYEDQDTAQGDALGFVNTLVVEQGRLDLGSAYWPAKPEASERPQRPASGCTAQELLEWKAADTAWAEHRELELTQWRRECHLAKSDGSQAADAPGYVLSGSSINALAESFGLPLKVFESPMLAQEAGVLVPVLLSAIQQLYTYMHSTEYKSQVVESFHEAMREARAARLQPPVSE